jgi:hypothetical protein
LIITVAASLEPVMGKYAREYARVLIHRFPLRPRVEKLTALLSAAFPGGTSMGEVEMVGRGTWNA